MTVTLLLAVAAITFGSRVAALAVLPEPRGAVARLTQRLPAPLFAALAAVSLAGADGLADPPVVAATVCALLSARWRSLLITLCAGLAGFGVAQIIW